MQILSRRRGDSQRSRDVQRAISRVRYLNHKTNDIKFVDPQMSYRRPPEQYISTILKPNSWGGAIELSIFAKQCVLTWTGSRFPRLRRKLTCFLHSYQTEIASCDVATGRVDRYGEGQYNQRFSQIYSVSANIPTDVSLIFRCLVIYSGIHYDACTLSPFPDAPTDFQQTVFPCSDKELIAVGEMAKKLKVW